MAKSNLTDSPAANANEVKSVTGRVAMDFSTHPAAIINPNATARDIASWAFSELDALREMLGLLACAKFDIEMGPEALAELVHGRLEPILLGLDEARGRV